MGKMKGNRLNTAANVGTFITSRQQLEVQRQLAAQGAVQAQLAAVQLEQIRQQQLAQLSHMRQQQLANEYSDLCRWADTEFNAGRMTKEQAEVFVAEQWHNRMTPPPNSSSLVTSSFRKSLVNSFSRDPAPGWYDEGQGTARWWNGTRWTIYSCSVREALARENAEGVSSQASQRHELTSPAGWYPTATQGLLAYWDGKRWTGQTRLDR